MPLDAPANPVGYAPFQPGVARYQWPLFGLAAVPPLPPELPGIVKQVFQCGSKYLGDERDLCTPGTDEPKWTELAFIGRSNAGKSTLLNSLLGSKDQTFVPVSKHPGKTEHIDFYAAGNKFSPPKFVLVDTPGYGFNRRGRDAGAEWGQLITRYLKHRSSEVLPRTVVLLDARQGLTDIDADVLTTLDSVAAPYHIVLTKADTVSQGDLEATALRVATALSKKTLPFPVLNAVSAHSGAGLQELMIALALTARLHRRFA